MDYRQRLFLSGITVAAAIAIAVPAIAFPAMLQQVGTAASAVLFMAFLFILYAALIPGEEEKPSGEREFS